jgi:hypothetical protein
VTATLGGGFNIAAQSDSTIPQFLEELRDAALSWEYEDFALPQ